ncbi:MAG: hypothetical protein H8E57_11145 [Candidatus Cloacimonetes bacterium]|nr:hypothetical protein [Candidatus Cloacimonadota bacterium]
MSVFIITYDFFKSRTFYKGFFEKINTYDNCYIFNSTWLIKSNEKAEEIWEKFRNYIDANDELLVMEVAADFSGFLSEESWDYLDKAF